jgi:hypothetical protein
MHSFIIRMSTAEYLTRVRIISNYLEYEFTNERDLASGLIDFDLQLLLKRLRTLREDWPDEKRLSECQGSRRMVLPRPGTSEQDTPFM